MPITMCLGSHERRTSAPRDYAAIERKRGGMGLDTRMTAQLATIAVSFAFALSSVLLLTPAMSRVATKLGIVSPARVDRWGSRPTPLLGGVAIVLATVLCSAALVTTLWPFLAVAGATLAAFVLG